MKLNFNRKSVWHTVKNTALVVLGTLMIAFGASVFQVPFNLIAGGMTGLAIVLAKIPLGALVLTEDFYIAVMTWGFFAIGLVLLGKKFAMKTLISTLVYPPAFTLCGMLVSSNLFGGLFNIGASQHSDAAVIVAAVFGGIAIGAGVALAFLGGGSTGGIDIVALAVSRKVKKLKSSQILLIIDSSVILIGAFVIKDLVISLLGIVSAFVSSIMIDRIFGGGSKAFTAYIISDEYEKINLAVREKIHRTSTLIPCFGGYSGKEKTMLTVSFDMRQYSSLLAAVLAIDKDAFITVQKAHEINGEGWTWGMHDQEKDDMKQQ